GYETNDRSAQGVDARAAAGGGAGVRPRAAAGRARHAGTRRGARSLVEPLTAAAAAARLGGRPLELAPAGAAAGARARQHALAQHEPPATLDGAPALPAMAAAHAATA